MTEEKKTEFTIKEDGFHGVLYECAKDNNPCPTKILICCSGSEGDFENSKTGAKMFSDNGINALALGYFKVPDAPDALNSVPIDYMEKAALYLKSIGYEKIGIWGISMGALYALLSASYYPDLFSLVFAASPNYYVIQAMNRSNSNVVPDKSAFSYQGQDIPYEPSHSSVNYLRMLWDSVTSLEPNYLSIYEDMMGNIAEEHIVPVEKMKARLVLITGKLDSIWPSNQGAEQIMARLKEKHYAYPYEHIVREKGGHLMTPFPTNLDKMLRANRRFPEEAEQYRQQHLQKLIDTYKEW